LWSLGQPHELNKPIVGRAVITVSEPLVPGDLPENALEYVRSHVVWLAALSPEEQHDLADRIASGAFRRMGTSGA
jgi:hypothetical protein